MTSFLILLYEFFQVKYVKIAKYFYLLIHSG